MSTIDLDTLSLVSVNAFNVEEAEEENHSEVENNGPLPLPVSKNSDAIIKPEL